MVQEETVKTDFSHERVGKQEKFASKKTHFYWWKKAPHQPITKLHGKTRDLVAGGQEEVVEGPTVTVRELRDVCQNEKITVQSHM